MRLPLVFATLAAVLAPAGARAVEPVLALRLGIGAALGSAARDVPMTDVVPVQYPFQLDLLGRAGPVVLGAYGSLAPATAGRCGSASCSAWVGRAGLQAMWTFLTEGGSAPWLGVATGYEWSTLSRTRDGTAVSRYRGPELFALQGGVEWRVLPWLALGPYGLLSFGTYTRYALDTGLAQATVAVPNQTTHAWFHAGVRGRLVLERGP